MILKRSMQFSLRQNLAGHLLEDRIAEIAFGVVDLLLQLEIGVIGNAGDAIVVVLPGNLREDALTFIKSHT